MIAVNRESDISCSNSFMDDFERVPLGFAQTGSENTRKLKFLFRLEGRRQLSVVLCM
jgi:hypothetical protein